MSKKRTLKTAARLYLLSAVLFLITAGCTPNPFFVPVAFIEGVPETGVAGLPISLTGIVSPVFANNNKIVWLVDDAGTTGASLDGNVLNTQAKGTVEVKARIINGTAEGKDYTQDFTIYIANEAYALFSITFAQIKDGAPTISGPTISISGTGADKKATLSIGSGYDNVKWEITGTGFSGKPGITETGNSFTLDATDVRYNKPGEHHLTLTVSKDGVPYNKTIIFTINP